MQEGPMEGREQDNDGVDLTQFDEAFKDAELVDRNAPVPDGTYQATVETLQVTRAKESRNPMLKWGLQIIGPTCAGRMVWRHNILVTPDNIKWAKTDLHTAGLDLEKFSDLPMHLDELIGVVLEITVRTKGENTSVYINQRVSEGLGTGEGAPF
jgi:hypothetical protein